MTTHPIAISAEGPFSFRAALGVFCRWSPITRFAPEGTRVRLAFPLDGDFTPVAAELDGDERGLRGRVAGARPDAIARQLARMFSLDGDARDWPEVGARDARLGRVMAALGYLRPVLFPSPYEAAAWAVLSQRISMEQAARVQARLVGEHGVRLRAFGGELRCFPPPDRLARVTALGGLPREKIDRLRGVATAAEAGLLDAARLRALGDVEAPRALRAIRGIGAFWSQGIYLRACGVRDVFPDEPRALAALGRLHGLGDRPPAAAVARLTARWSPYRMWACFLLRIAAGRERYGQNVTSNAVSEGHACSPAASS